MLRSSGKGACVLMEGSLKFYTPSVGLIRHCTALREPILSSYLVQAAVGSFQRLGALLALDRNQLQLNVFMTALGDRY